MSAPVGQAGEVPNLSWGELGNGTYFGNSIASAWDWWKNRLMPVTLGDYNLFREQFLNRQAYSHDGMREIQTAKAKVAGGKAQTISPDADYLSLCLSNPSTTTLEDMKRYIQLSMGHHEHFNGLFRLSQFFEQSSTRVLEWYGGTMRTPTIDRKLIDLFKEFVDESNKYNRRQTMETDMEESSASIKFAVDDGHLVNLIGQVYQLLAPNPVLYDVRSVAYGLEGAPNFASRSAKQVPIQWGKDLERLLPQEFKVLRDVEEAMREVGVQLVPTAYALRRTKATHLRPTTSDQLYITELSVLANKPHEDLDVDALYIQHFDGILLEDSNIPVELLNQTIGYIHHMLAYLKNKIGFSHGNLHSKTILLAYYNPENPSTYVLPLVDENGTELTRVSLPFLPILIDLTHATTNTHSQYTSTSSVHSNELCDIVSLYMIGQASGYLGGYSYIREALGPSFFEFQQDVYDVSWRLPPYGRVVEGVTHTALANLYREQPIYTTVKSPVGKLYSEPRKIDYVSVESVRLPDIVSTARSLLSFYEVPESSPEPYSYVFDTIHSYLKETISYHGGKATPTTPVKKPKSRTPTPKKTKSRTPSPKKSVRSPAKAPTPSQDSDEEIEEIDEEEE